MRIGLEKLQADCPAQAAKIPVTIRGSVSLETAGDFFQVANYEYGFLVRLVIGILVLNFVITALLLLSHKEKQPKSESRDDLKN